VHWLVQAPLPYLQITATSKEMDLNIVADKSSEVQLLEPSALKSLPVPEVGIVIVTTTTRAARGQVADIHTERSRLALLLQPLVSQPRQPPNMSRTARQTRKRQAEVVHELGAYLDVAILMTMISMMTIVAEEAEADMPIPSIVLLKWPRPELPPLLLLE
jgi:hypothetical protein